MMEIDKNSPIPIYHQLYEILRKKIEDEVFKVGDYLPPENKLAQDYEVSRLTVRQALAELVDEGLIKKRRGKGTLVIQPKSVENLMELRGFTNDALKAGYVPSSVVLENKLLDVPGAALERMKLQVGAKVIFLKRLRLLNDVPYAIECAYINPALDTRILKVLEMDMSKSSLYVFFKETLGMNMKYADETLEITHIDRENANLLGIKNNSCVVLRRRFTYTQDEKCVEYVQSLYRADKYKFNIRLRGM
jgi:GntR family transcriptional regulator